MKSNKRNKNQSEPVLKEPEDTILIENRYSLLNDISLTKYDKIYRPHASISRKKLSMRLQLVNKKDSICIQK
jgi:hypothetical protein